MADEDHLRILKQGALAWNDWRRLEGEHIKLDLRKADLSGVNLSGADLSGAGLSESSLKEADLRKADLSGVDLSGADLGGVRLSGTNLSGADLSGANLGGAIFSDTDLRGTDLSDVNLSNTIFSDVDLATCKNLESILHLSPSSIDIRTLQRSGPLPLVFLRNVGLPDKLIDYLPALLHQSIQFYSCFISYSSKNEEFVRRLHADLQVTGVRGPCRDFPDDRRDLHTVHRDLVQRGTWMIWAIALVGVLLKLIAPRHAEPLSVPLYLIMGWTVLSDPGLLLSLPASVVTLLVAGGVFYTAGITFHLARMRFQEAIWHCFVLAAAACHYAAVVRVAA